MSNNEKWFGYFLVGSFITAALMISLYRAIRTTNDIFGFLFLSSFIIMFFTTFLLESMIMDSIIEKIVEVAKKHVLVYKLVFFSFFISITILIPTTIMRNVKLALADKKNTSSANCLVVINKLFDSPRYAYDKRLLSTCQYTQPLTKAFSTQKNGKTSGVQNVLNVVDGYMGLISKNLSFGLTLVIGIISGASFLATLGAAIKSGWALFIGLLSSTAVKMIMDG